MTRLTLLLVGVVLAGDCGGTSAALTCEQMKVQYDAALAAARACDPAAADQCRGEAYRISPGCPSLCKTIVNDDASLTPLLARWRASGCESIPGTVCVAGCLVPEPGHCEAGDAATGACSDHSI